MPRLQIDYSKTIIYKIVCKDVNIKECYVGQTTDFTKRKCRHKSNCNNINSKNYNIYVYSFIRDNNGWENWDMIEIEKYNATDQLDASKRERFYIEQLQATLNKQLPTRTDKEYYIEYNKKYWEKNKVFLKENYKEYCEQNKDKIIEYKKEYREQNKDKIKELKKDYYEQNKDKILEKITCICGIICNKSSLKKHEKTKKHIEFVKTI